MANKLGKVSYLAEKCTCGHSMMYHDYSSPNPQRRPCGECDCRFWNPAKVAPANPGERDAVGSNSVNYPDEAEPQKCPTCGGYHLGGCHRANPPEPKRKIGGMYEAEAFFPERDGLWVKFCESTDLGAFKVTQQANPPVRDERLELTLEHKLACVCSDCLALSTNEITRMNLKQFWKEPIARDVLERFAVLRLARSERVKGEK